MAEPGIAAEMTERLTATRPVEIADADHDAHLDRPDEWREALSGFLDSLHGQA
jgi:pimeloyl-ACP methyl ester carboxylesterase